MKKPLPLAMALLGLASCAFQPEPLVRYETASTEDTWNNGVRLHSAKTRSFQFTTAYLALPRTSPETDYGTPLTFSVLAENSTDQPVTLDPLHFRAALPFENADLAAIDPELELRKAEQDLRSEHGRWTREQGIDAAFSLPILLVDIAASPNRTPEQEAKAREEAEEERQAEKTSEKLHARIMREAEARYRLWSSQALRKTTVLPGKQIQGTICFLPTIPAVTPDTLILQYRDGDGLTAGSGYADLSRYGKVVDTVSKVSKKRPSSKRLPLHTDY